MLNNTFKSSMIQKRHFSVVLSYLVAYAAYSLLKKQDLIHVPENKSKQLLYHYDINCDLILGTKMFEHVASIFLLCY